MQSAAQVSGMDPKQTTIREQLITRIDTAKNHYETLGVGRTADKAEIQSAFRQDAFLLHEDRIAGATDAVKLQCGNAFGKLKEAYDVLRYPDARSKYDQENAGVGARQHEHSQTGPTPSYTSRTAATPEELQGLAERVFSKYKFREPNGGAAWSEWLGDSSPLSREDKANLLARMIC